MDNTILESWNYISNILQQYISINIIVNIILLILGSAITIYLTWFGIRTLVNTIKDALVGKLEVGSTAHRNYYKNRLGWDDQDYNDNFNL